MASYIGTTGLTYLWGKIKSIFATKEDVEDIPRPKIYMGTCASAANTYAKEATVETFPLDANSHPLEGTVIGVKYDNSNSYKTAGSTHTLNVNSTGTFPLYYNNAELVSTTSANTLVAGYKNRYTFYMFNGSQWVWVSSSYDANSTYSAMTQAEITAGTGTTGRTMTPKMLRDNFYTETEVDDLLDDKEDTISDLADIRSGAALGATALQSYTETDPTVPSWAKASSKPSYTAAEVGAVPTSRTVNGKALSSDITLSATDVSALPSSTVIPAAPGTLNTDNSTAQTVSSSEALSGTIKLHKVSKTGSYNDLLNKPTIPAAQIQSDWNQSTTTALDYIKNKPTIPTVPTNVSAFNNDAGYLTSHQDISGKEDKVSVGTISGTSLSASIGTYYVGSNVGTLTVTLPTISDSTHVANVVLNIATGSSAAVTFTAASGISILYSKDFAIESSMEYEVNCLWQGTKWLITAVEFESQS